MHPIGAPPSSYSQSKHGLTRAHPLADLALTTVPNSLNPFPLRAFPADHCLSSTPMQARKLTIPERTTSMRSSGAPHHPIYPTHEVFALLSHTAFISYHLPQCVPQFDHEITRVIFVFLAHCRE